MFFLRKHDFSRKFEGGTGLQGVSSNLNILILRDHITRHVRNTLFKEEEQKKVCNLIMEVKSRNRKDLKT